jgi:hypothetical protein
VVKEEETWAVYLIESKIEEISLFVEKKKCMGKIKEMKQTDYDLGKAIQTGSLSAAKIERDSNGNLVAASVDAFCSAQEKDYNCADFTSQPEAQQVYDRCKTLGQNMDVYHLDGDKDGVVCESLPKTSKK